MFGVNSTEVADYLHELVPISRDENKKSPTDSCESYGGELRHQTLQVSYS